MSKIATDCSTEARQTYPSFLRETLGVLLTRSAFALVLNGSDAVQLAWVILAWLFWISEDLVTPFVHAFCCCHVEVVEVLS